MYYLLNAILWISGLILMGAIRCRWWKAIDHINTFRKFVSTKMRKYASK